MNRTTSHRGFTLIEIAVATAAAAILISAVFMVLTGITRDREKIVMMRTKEMQYTYPMVELLRRDLVSASSLKDDNGDVVLHTFSRLNSQSLETSDRPSLVTYRIENQEGVKYLVREQQTLDEPVPPPLDKSLIACCVRRIEVQPIPKANDPSQASMTRTQSEFPQDDRGFSRVRVQIEFDDSSPKIDQVLCLQ